MSLNIPITTKIIYDKASSDAPYVAYSPELDVSSCGPTPEKAKEMLYEAIEIVLEEAAKENKLDEYLESVGYTKDKKGLVPPKVSFEPFFFSFPK